MNRKQNAVLQVATPVVLLLSAVPNLDFCEFLVNSLC